MGCSISCNIFEKISTFLHWLVEKKSGLSKLDHYLDDFIFAGQENSERCKTLMNYFLSIFQDLGIPMLLFPLGTHYYGVAASQVNVSDWSYISTHRLLVQ